MPRLDHLLVTGRTEAESFRSPLTVRTQLPPDRDRKQHGESLLAQLQIIGQESQRLEQARAAAGIEERLGIALAVEISPAGILDAGKKLEWKREGIEVLNVVDLDGSSLVTVYVPEGKLSAFERRVKEYLQVDRAPRKEGDEPKPAHISLINCITNFRRAVFQEMWTDELDPPAPEQESVFQIWLRRSGKAASEVHINFRQSASRFGIAIEPGYLSFPGRVVVAVRTTRRALEEAVDLLDVIAEIRGTRISAEFFLSGLRPFEQAQWVRDLADRTSPPSPASATPFITLMDTGVNRAHPLIAPLLSEEDMHTVLDHWGKGDHDGHGTEMAGLALHGDLRNLLAQSTPNEVPHRLESVKTMPVNGQTPSSLYGWVANEAVARIEARDPDRLRTFATMTTASGDTSAMPSEWSATLDRLAFGMHGENDNEQDLPALLGNTPVLRPRLFVVSAGNLHWSQWNNYPDQNDLERTEDPAQAWNVLSVGANTDLIDFDTSVWPDLRPIAAKGCLSPASRTSVFWPRQWPHKPDVVAEGGNGSKDARPGMPVAVGPADLRLLTTSHEPSTVMLAESGDTSAATAEVARVCAHLQRRYPSYWPETVRAVVANSATYTTAMQARLDMTQTQRETLVGRYGFGRVQIESALNSQLRKPTVVLQETIVPYAVDGQASKLGMINLHDLPWPTSELEALGSTQVALKVTLSYFIQPNPSRRGWQSKFKYQSHGLRFAVRAASETHERFLQRINRVRRDQMGDDREDSMPDPDNTGWLLGSRIRSRGSMHCDTWFGTAQQLAHKSEIAVFPVGGWWKEMGRYLPTPLKVRYALVVSLEAFAATDVDIYTPIANEIAITVPS